MTYSELLNKICRINVSNTIKQGECMHNYKFSEDLTNKVIQSYEKSRSKNNVDDLVNEIHRTNEMFTIVDIPEYKDVAFDRMENVSISAEEIEKQAIESLADYKNTNINNIEKGINEKSDALNKNKVDLIESAEAEKKNIEKYYDNAIQTASDDALRRGLSRSSIVINKIDAFNQDELQAYKDLEKEYSSKLNAIDFELNSLNQQKQQAINDFDIAYAVKLNDKIAKLTDDLRKQQEEILKYNNEIAEKEEDYKLKYKEMVNDIKNTNISNNLKMTDLVAKYGQNAINNYRYNQISDIVDKYFANMSKEEIVDILANNQQLKKELGSSFDSIVEKYR